MWQKHFLIKAALNEPTDDGRPYNALHNIGLGLAVPGVASMPLTAQYYKLLHGQPSENIVKAKELAERISANKEGLSEEALSALKDDVIKAYTPSAQRIASSKILGTYPVGMSMLRSYGDFENENTTKDIGRFAHYRDYSNKDPFIAARRSLLESIQQTAVRKAMRKYRTRELGQKNWKEFEEESARELNADQIENALKFHFNPDEKIVAEEAIGNALKENPQWQKAIYPISAANSKIYGKQILKHRPYSSAALGTSLGLAAGGGGLLSLRQHLINKKKREKATKGNKHV